MDIFDGRVDGSGHEFMHLFRLITFNKVRSPAAALQELIQFLMFDASQYSRIADLVTIKVQNRQHRTIRPWIEKLVRLPRGCKRARFRLAVTDNAGDDQVRIIKCGTKGMTQRIAQLAALVNGPRRRRRNMAGDSAGKRELLKELLQSGFVLSDVWINLAPGAFEIHVSYDRGAAMSWPGDVEHIQVILLDDPVQMDVDEILPWRCSPMGDHQWLDVFKLQRFLQEGIVIEVDLADRDIIGCPPIGVHTTKQVWSESRATF